VGVSVSDPLHIIAQSLGSVENNNSLFVKLKEIVDREHVNLIVVGMPFNLKGQKAQKAREVEMFVIQLKKAIHVEVLSWDERFTSTLAHRSLLQMGTKRKDRRENKGRVDAMAAAIMLQSFLDSRRRSSGC